VPPDYYLDEERPNIAKELRGAFDLDDDDVIIIGTAADYERAEDGLWPRHSSCCDGLRRIGSMAEEITLIDRG